ncbi:MAG TPA: hypothetical protein VD861_01555 [Pyrinomonadaceae bacterium]|nr:hypothetical protein [Pyrinomonadaceae bacterium]
MNRFFWACALFALFLAGCGKSSNTTNQTVNTPPPAGSSIATSTPESESKDDQGDDGDGEEEGTEEEDEGDVTGAYFPAGPLPAEFAGIEHLSLATIDAEGKPSDLNGFIRPKERSARDYTLVEPKLEGKFLTFTTSAVKGVSFSFEGAFERLDDFSQHPPANDELILKGTLTKLEDGEKAALTRVAFTYSAGG